MRRKDREITDYDAMLAVMKECDCCRLGFRDGEGVYIVPLNFGISEEDGTPILWFHCAKEGKKLELMRSNPRVGFEMDSGHSIVRGATACEYSFGFKSVIGKGELTRVDDGSEKRAALDLIMNRYGPEAPQSYDEKVMDKMTVLKLKVTEWSCKANI